MTPYHGYLSEVLSLTSPVFLITFHTLSFQLICCHSPDLPSRDFLHGHTISTLLFRFHWCFPHLLYLFIFFILFLSLSLSEMPMSTYVFLFQSFKVSFFFITHVSLLYQYCLITRSWFLSLFHHAPLLKSLDTFQAAITRFNFLHQPKILIYLFHVLFIHISNTVCAYIASSSLAAE